MKEEDMRRGAELVEEITRMMQTDIGRRIGYKVARSRTMRPVTARVSRGRTRK